MGQLEKFPGELPTSGAGGTADENPEKAEVRSRMSEAEGSSGVAKRWPEPPLVATAGLR